MADIERPVTCDNTYGHEDNSWIDKFLIGEKGTHPCDRTS